MKMIVCVLLALFCSSIGANCLSNSIALQVLGSGGPELNDGRASTGYLIWRNGKAVLMVDIGPGTSVNYGHTEADFTDLDAILLSHLHVDHAGDLPAFIKGSYFTARNVDLAILGPDKNSRMPSTGHYIQAMLGEKGSFAYLADYVHQELASDYHLSPTNVNPSHGQKSEFQINEFIKVAALGVHHGPIAALGWRVEIDKCVISFSGDMSNKLGIFGEFAAGSDILVVHNAVPENVAQAGRNLHMTPSEIGKLIKQAQPKKVVLSHRMNRTLGREKETLYYIKQVYSGPVEFANDLSIFRLNSKTD
jgi:ribonuclease BN (tRNA processing enzyme)